MRVRGHLKLNCFDGLIGQKSNWNGFEKEQKYRQLFHGKVMETTDR